MQLYTLLTLLEPGIGIFKKYVKDPKVAVDFIKILITSRQTIEPHSFFALLYVANYGC
jgi:hypothetical protein